MDNSLPKNRVCPWARKQILILVSKHGACAICLASSTQLCGSRSHSPPQAGTSVHHSVQILTLTRTTISKPTQRGSCTGLSMTIGLQPLRPSHWLGLICHSSAPFKDPSTYWQDHPVNTPPLPYFPFPSEPQPSTLGSSGKDGEFVPSVRVVTLAEEDRPRLGESLSCWACLR